ncbi:hypothetical protein J2Z53_001591 [Clostridium moniliforme]|uniref:Uncharacterized protein n=1 Tax=Clostridium moniliforme TaxID=39489 RepID=A0ABS4F1A0_9CLOT|nr:hypothetical protein [Clostridium moniliforme]
MFNFKLPGSLKVKKVILAILIIVCLGILVNKLILNKENTNKSNINTETQIKSK